MCFLFVYSVCFSFFFLSIYLFIFSCAVHWIPGFPSHPKTPTKKNRKIQNPKSKIQIKKRRSASPLHVCLPNTCVCPPVCPTVSSPKAQTFEPPLTIHWALCPIFFIFSCHQSCSGFFCAVHGFPITSQNANKKNRKIQNPNSKIQIKKRRSVSALHVCLPNTCVCPTRVSAHPSAQQLRPQRLKHLNPPLPFISIHFDEKIGLFAPYFSCFSCHQSCSGFFCAVHGFPITSQNASQKKLREFPLGGPSPCGKTGLAPCRQCTSSIFLHSFFGYFFSFVFYLFIHSMFFLFSLFIHCFSFFPGPGRSLDFPSHPKKPQKKCARVPFRGPSPVAKQD